MEGIPRWNETNFPYMNNMIPPTTPKKVTEDVYESARLLERADKMQTFLKPSTAMIKRCQASTDFIPASQYKSEESDDEENNVLEPALSILFKTARGEELPATQQNVKKFKRVFSQILNECDDPNELILAGKKNRKESDTENKIDFSQQKSNEIVINKGKKEVTSTVTSNTLLNEPPVLNEPSWYNDGLDDYLLLIMEENEQKNGQANENGMAKLRSFSEQDQDMSVEHAAISELQQTEDIIVKTVGQHRAMNDFLDQFLQESRELYNTTNYVDYDQNAYCKRFEEIFTQLAAQAVLNDFCCKDLITEFRSKLAREKMLSHKMNPGK